MTTAQRILPFDTAVISVRRPGAAGITYLKYMFMMVHVTDYTLILSDERSTPLQEWVRFNCMSYSVVYIEQLPTGLPGAPIMGAGVITAAGGGSAGGSSSGG
jgi:hypothetical protein